MAASGEFVEHTTAMAVEEKAKLQKHFSRFDMLFFLICTLVGVDTLGQVSSYGAQGFTWLIFLGIFFFIPYALLTAEIGSAFTEEGGPYVWTKLAWGRFLACLNGVLYWISNPIWMGGLLTITAIETFSVFFTSLDNRVLFYGFGALFIWFGTVAAILSFGIGKWIPTIGAWSRMIMLGFFTLTTIIYAAKEGVHAPSFGDFKPTYALFIGLVPVLFFNYVGFELPSTAGDEMENPQRDVPFTVLRSAIASILLYGVPILAIIFVLPAAALSGLGGFIDAMKTVFTVYGGNVTTASDGTLSVTLSTLAVAGAFSPVRGVIQRAVDRRFNRAGYDAQAAVDGFSEQLRNSIDLDALCRELRAVVAGTVEPEHASVWLRSPEARGERLPAGQLGQGTGTAQGRLGRGQQAGQLGGHTQRDQRLGELDA